MNIKVVIVGFGSIGKKHYNILKNHFKIKNICIVTKQLLKKKLTVKSIYDLKFIPDLIVVANNTSQHINSVKIIEKKYKNLSVLVEKPLFDKNYKLKKLKNRYFVGYNMRFNPIIRYLKKVIKNQKFFSVQVTCNSFLPLWRKGINYQKSYSAFKDKGGGVTLDLSHEIDYVKYLFGKIKIKYCDVRKISKLKIKSEDHLFLQANTSNIKYIGIFLNYYSQYNQRFIKIDGSKKSYFADFLKRKISIFSPLKKKREISFKNKKDADYIDQYKDLFKGKKVICTFKDALSSVHDINKIKNYR